MSSLRYWLWLSSAEGLNASARAALIRYYGNAEQAFFAPEGEFENIEGISAREAEILEKRDTSRISQIEDECAENNISIVTMEDSSYPERLKNIYAPPPVIYLKGKIKNPDALPSVAVIGTRRASPYGLKMGREMAWQICRCGGSVISMLGSGIDLEAAKGALIAGGRCIGVLGQPHERHYGGIYEDICRSGALISEYPPGMKTQKSFFRERNRIASGISLGVVVIEAPAKSGTRLFAIEAAEQGKEIFAMPGNADAYNCAGSNALIKEGAKLVTDGSEVMSEFQPQYPDIINLSFESCPEAAEEPEPEVPKEPAEKDKRQTKKKEPEPVRERETLKGQLSSLSEEQLKIIAAIDKNAAHIDDIIETTGLPTARVLSQLTVLEIKGFVKREAGRRITLNTAKK